MRTGTWATLAAGAAGAVIVRRAVAARALARRGAADRVALVTGASRGLGFAIAADLAARGFRLAICAREPAELAVAQAELAARGAEVLALRCDVADRAQVDDLVRAVIERFGRLDVVVNNAGIIEVGPLAAMTVEDFADTHAVMFWGMLYPTIAALPHLRERGRARIINITSIGGRISAPHLLPYNCAKFAAVGFSEGLRAELSGSGVTVTTVVPGLMRTGSHLRAQFKGRANSEYAWFALAASLPLLSMGAERAARRIVDAGLAGRAELVLTPAAKLGTRVHGLFPATTVRVLGWVNRLLPAAPGPAGPAVAGSVAAARLDSGLLEAATTMGRSAAQRLHQHT
ncbi:short-subunit dehydrogenase [Krasilnikovia cinnamomea]|uniref:Short-subunit dehydrogenase n=1 Tax=Krasilnikovia cinnamomea TaxID=349313 RepID=A0A4Q7ZRT5_9ACTN|nr:SDR family NAD(P)-dependent oxidoreductase [Krasilnikovia cinnamomea]RZU53868.1 short-subunit dehydrogenase [Krasilnikovia cinnamomea]